MTCDPRVLEVIASHARRASPLECCGLLIGRTGRVDEAVPVENRAADPARRYEIDPVDYFASIKRCRGTGQAVVGAYHSHPRSEPVPSPSDAAEAFSGFLYVIAGPAVGDATLEIRAYCFVDGNFQPVRLVPDAEGTWT